ncbi:hypothetical protein [Bacteroides sp.]|uniref:hypothetical protein n=1 Tax=Bacteroides sp. TaxID=29523 RepID=UPI001DCD511F|nr:hypothetical protein [Bacteroides sp.]MBS6966612.1 hypothetical protein [Bacteroides sp.]
MKLHLKYLWIVLVTCTLTACMNGGGDLAGKWQLRDSVFYNFQKGSFSAICLLKDGGATTFFGNYSLKGAEISIILLPESVNDKNYDTYFGWPEGKRIFKVEDLSYSSLRLEYEGTKSVFRKF